MTGIEALTESQIEALTRDIRIYSIALPAALIAQIYARETRYNLFARN